MDRACECGSPRDRLARYGISPKLIFARDNSSYREQKASIRPFLPTFQAKYLQNRPFLPVFPSRPRHAVDHPVVDHDGGPAAIVEAPVAPRDPHQLPPRPAPPVSHPDRYRPRAGCANRASGIRADGWVLAVGPRNISSAIAPPGPCQIGRFGKKRGAAGSGGPSGASTPPGPCQNW